MLCSLFIAGQPLAEHHKPENSQKGKERKYHLKAKTQKQNIRRTLPKNRLKHHDRTSYTRWNWKGNFIKDKWISTTTSPARTEWDQERERRETEHHLRMETMRIQHNREIEMRA